MVQGAPYDARIEMKPDGDDTKARAAQGMYVSLSAAGKDSICIAGISVTWLDGVQFAWYGDVAEHCGAPWYHSKTILSAEDLYTPKCMWMDSDGTDGVWTKGMSLHLPSFVATAERAQSMTDDFDLWCNVAPRLRFWDQLTEKQPVPYFDPPLEFQPVTMLDYDPAAVKNPAGWKIQPPLRKKKGLKRRQEPQDIIDDGYDDEYETADEDQEGIPFTNHTLVRRQEPNRGQSRFQGALVKSTMDGQSAKELCKSESSMGPDFVSIKEKRFCDMTRKKSWPLCDDETTHSCFDTKVNAMVGGKLNRRRDDATSERIIRKRYATVHEW